MFQLFRRCIEIRRYRIHEPLHAQAARALKHLKHETPIFHDWHKPEDQRRQYIVRLTQVSQLDACDVALSYFRGAARTPEVAVRHLLVGLSVSAIDSLRLLPR